MLKKIERPVPNIIDYISKNLVKINRLIDTNEKVRLLIKKIFFALCPLGKSKILGNARWS
ncbi:MAG: hypothetical protein A2X78_01590 [Gammaproteobacteria bacterium GWE2_37_16]|nr:MAG: hypothetical protein A2X78_01590 [Gammaproteobacteria bacterium GWE2_37_16]